MRIHRPLGAAFAAALLAMLSSSASAQQTVTTAGGTTSYIPAFTGTATLGNSIIQVNSTGVGIGKAPNGTLDVNGQLVARGMLTLGRLGNATSSLSYNSAPIVLQSAAYNSSSKTGVTPFFQLQSNAVNNNTATPGATLNFYYSNGTSAVANTGLYINSDGTIHFATAQTFPSTGTGITTVSHDASLTGSGTSASPLGIASVGHDANFSGSGTSASPLSLASTVNVTELEASQNITANNNGNYGAALTGSDLSGNGIGVRGSSIASSGNGSGYGGIFEGDIGLFAFGADYAGYFSGEVYVSGNLAKSGGSFKIDHPLDPENKYLYHSFVESPDMMNIYNGNVTTDGSGIATVTMPDWFETLNQDFRYQLTVVGQFSQAIVGEKMSDNHFIIRTDKPNVEVSWQVTGIRHDKWADAHRIPVEEEKSEADRGSYLHPELYGHPEQMSIVARRANMRTPSAQ